MKRGTITIEESGGIVFKRHKTTQSVPIAPCIHQPLFPSSKVNGHFPGPIPKRIAPRDSSRNGKDEQRYRGNPYAQYEQFCTHV